MKTNFDDAPFPDGHENPLVQAVHELDKTQEDFFKAAAELVRIPTDKKLQAFNTTLEANGNAFYDVVMELAGDDSVEPEERSMQIATLFIDTDKDRVKHFKKIAPKGEFARIPETRQRISEIILNKFQNHEDLDTICFEIVTNYANHLNADTKRLIESVESGNKMKYMKYADQAKDNASQVGKISLGVLIGGIIASRIIKKIDEN